MPDIEITKLIITCIKWVEIPDFKNGAKLLLIFQECNLNSCIFVAFNIVLIQDIEQTGKAEHRRQAQKRRTGHQSRGKQILQRRTATQRTGRQIHDCQSGSQRRWRQIHDCRTGSQTRWRQNRETHGQGEG
jgi:hypothetical protein